MKKALTKYKSYDDILPRSKEAVSEIVRIKLLKHQSKSNLDVAGIVLQMNVNSFDNDRCLLAELCLLMKKNDKEKLMKVEMLSTPCVLYIEEQKGVCKEKM